MAKFVISEGTLRVQLSAFEAYRAKRSSFSIELWRVKEVVVATFSQRATIGTQLTGRKAYTGLFASRGSRSFVYWPNKTDAVKIVVADPAFDQIVIGVQDASQIAEGLQAQLNANRGQ